MNKHGRKNGITAHKFMIEIHMTKVELKLAQQCRISVIFKRGKFSSKSFFTITGEHKKETVNAPVLDKGVAYFDERLAVPSIFYFDEARNAFLSKEVQLQHSNYINESGDIGFKHDIFQSTEANGCY